jgi:hypothetical protein
LQVVDPEEATGVGEGVGVGVGVGVEVEEGAHAETVQIPKSVRTPLETEVAHQYPKLVPPFTHLV